MQLCSNIGDMEGMSYEQYNSIVVGISNNDYTELNNYMLK